MARPKEAPYCITMVTYCIIQSLSRREDSWVVVPLHSILKQQQQEQNEQPQEQQQQQHSKPEATSNSKASKSATKAAGGTSYKRVTDAMVPPGCLEGTRLTLVKVRHT
jgi:hypothetical protein